MTPLRNLKARWSYWQESRLGISSTNEWIRKSAKISGWLHKGEHEFLWDLAMRPLPGNVLEIGVWQGKSTCILAGACIERGDDSRVICVDTFRMDGTSRQVAYYNLLQGRRSGTFYQFIDNAERFGFADMLITLACPSSNLDHILLSSPLRLAFLDGQHDYEGVRGDLEMVMPLVVPGGVIAVHDVYERYPGILQAIEDVSRECCCLRPLGQVHCLSAYTVEERIS